MGYWDRFSARPGDNPELKVSVEDGSESFAVEVIRLTCGDDSPAGPGFKAQVISADINMSYPARRQPIPVGSYIRASAPATRAGGSVTLAAFIMPTLLSKPEPQCILSCQDPSNDGFALLVDPSGRAAFWMRDRHGEKIIACDRPMRERQWYLLIATVDAASKHIAVLQRPVAGSHRMEREFSRGRKAGPTAPAGRGRIDLDRRDGTS